MSAVALVASVVLGAAFVMAGASKLAAGPQWPVQAQALGAPPVAIPIVPWFELVLGALLIVQLFEPIPAIAALVALVAFTALIVVRIRQGRRPPCACFGAWSATPIGAGHVARNVGLIALAVLAIAG